MTDNINDIGPKLRGQIIDLFVAAIKTEVDCPVKQFLITLAFGEGMDKLAREQAKDNNAPHSAEEVLP